LEDDLLFFFLCGIFPLLSEFVSLEWNQKQYANVNYSINRIEMIDERVEKKRRLERR
jgi:hypothetical protein